MSWGLRFRVRQYVKSSLWLMPLVGGPGRAHPRGGVALLARGTRATSPCSQYSPETATAVVSATIAAAVSLTGFVVTVTVLGVQQATGIFSPRYMRAVVPGWAAQARAGGAGRHAHVLHRRHPPDPARLRPGHQREPDGARPRGRPAAVPALLRPVPASHAARGGRGAAGPRGAPRLRGLDGRGRPSRPRPRARRALERRRPRRRSSCAPPDPAPSRPSTSPGSARWPESTPA